MEHVTLRRMIAAVLLAGIGMPIAASADVDLTFAAIQTEVNACAVTGCTIKLRCGTPTTPYSSSVSAAVSQVSFGTKKNITIQGCGLDATSLEWHATVTSSGTFDFQIFDVTSATGGGGITFRDMTVWLEVFCSGGTCPAKGSIVKVEGKVSNVKFERVHFKSTLNGPNSAADIFPAGIRVAADGANRPKGVSVFSSKLETSGTGLALFDCDDCWANGNYFEAPTPAPNTKNAFAFAVVSKGDGIRILNNSFELKGSGSPLPVGVYLSRLGGATPGEGAQVVANTFYAIPNALSRAIVLDGYNDAIIDANRFRCDAGFIPACFSVGVSSEGAGCGGLCNRRNIVSNNVFDRFYDDASTSCPVHFGAPGDDKNLVVGNMFSIWPAGSGTGTCGTGFTSSSNKVVTTP